MVDYDQFSDITKMDIVRCFYKGAKHFYEDPKNKEAFEKWLSERRKKKANG